MTWVRLDDNMPTHPKVLSVGPDAAYLHICGICYCARLLTDGRIPKAALPLLGGPVKALPKLLEAGLWSQDGDDYIVDGYLDWNPTREQVESDRRRNADRQSRYRRRNGVSNGVTNGATNSVSNAAPSHPIPSHPNTGSLQQQQNAQTPLAAAAEEVARRRGLPELALTKERPQRWLTAAMRGIQDDLRQHPDFGRLVHGNATSDAFADLLEPAPAPRLAIAKGDPGCLDCFGHGWVIRSDEASRCDCVTREAS